MSEPSDKLLSEFVDAWNAGSRPRVGDFLDRAAPAERYELADRLDDWLTMAPAPAYSEQALADIRAEMAELAPLPEVLPGLRERAGLKLRDLAARVTATFGLAGEEERTENYLRQLERGELDETRVSRRLLDALADALGVAALRGATAAPGGAMFRAAPGAGMMFEADLEVLSQAAMAPAPPPMDELDRLFLGGPDA